MKKLRVVMLVLVAMFALSALAASPASAEITLLAEWLANGNPILEPLAVDAEGFFVIIDMTSVTAMVACEALIEGTVGPGENDTVTMLWDLATPQKLIPTAGETGFLVAGTGLLCEGIQGCEKDPTETEVWPTGLPYTSSLFLMEDGTFLDLVTAANVGWEVQSLILGSLTLDECKGTDIEVQVVNLSGGGVANLGLSVPGTTCTVGGAGKGFTETNETENKTTLVGGEALTVSSI